MTTNFTFRDFFVYLIIGIIAIISIGIIYIDDISLLSWHFFKKYRFLNNFSILGLVFAIPIIYFIGHIIGAISYNLLGIYLRIYKRYTKKGKELLGFKHWSLMRFEQILYRQRIAYAIDQYIIGNNIYFKDDEEFWTLCARLQVRGNYSYAEYWYVLNELFNSANIVFFISTIISLFTGEWLLGAIFLALSLFAFKRAMQYAKHFVKTVVRLIKAQNELDLKGGRTKELMEK